MIHLIQGALIPPARTVILMGLRGRPPRLAGRGACSAREPWRRIDAATARTPYARASEHGRLRIYQIAPETSCSQAALGNACVFQRALIQWDARFPRVIACTRDPKTLDIRRLSKAFCASISFKSAGVLVPRRELAYSQKLVLTANSRTRRRRAVISAISRGSGAPVQRPAFAHVQFDPTGPFTTFRPTTKSRATDAS